MRLLRLLRFFAATPLSLNVVYAADSSVTVAAHLTRESAS